MTPTFRSHLPCGVCGTHIGVFIYEFTKVESPLYLCPKCAPTAIKKYDKRSFSFKGSDHFKKYYKRYPHLKPVYLDVSS